MVTITGCYSTIIFFHRVQSSKQSENCPESNGTSYNVDQCSERFVEANTKAVPLLLEALKRNCHPEAKEEEFVPAFPPGRVLHITVPEIKSTNA